MEKREYSISRDKVRDLYKKLPKNFKEPLYIQLVERQNRYKDEYRIVNNAKATNIVYDVGRLYDKNTLEADAEFFYRDVNMELNNYNATLDFDIQSALKDLVTIGNILYKNKPLSIPNEDGPDGPYLKPAISHKAFNRVLKVAHTNRQKKPLAGQFVQAVQSKTIQLSKDGVIYSKGGAIGFHNHTRAKVGNKVVWLYQLTVNNETYSIILGNYKKDTESISQLMVNVFGQLSEINVEQSANSDYSGSSSTLVIDSVVEDGEVVALDELESFKQYLKETTEQYNITDAFKLFKKIKLMDTSIVYQGRELATYNLKSELIEDGEQQVYHFISDIQLFNDDNYELVIGYTVISRDEVLGDMYIDDSDRFDYVEDIERLDDEDESYFKDEYDDYYEEDDGGNYTDEFSDTDEW